MPAEKYTAIYNDLKQKIEGLYAPQSVLPSENILTTRYGVFRNTVRRAIAKLADGYGAGVLRPFEARVIVG